MRRVYYNKLIRDKIPEKITKAGVEYEVREITDDQEYRQELLKKVREESLALSQARSKDDFLSEYADLAEVFDALLEELGITTEEIEEARKENQQKKGGYKKRFFLHWSSDSGYKSNESVQGIKE